MKSLTVCSYHVTYTFQSESTLYICLNVKELLARTMKSLIIYYPFNMFPKKYFICTFAIFPYQYICICYVSSKKWQFLSHDNTPVIFTLIWLFFLRNTDVIFIIPMAIALCLLWMILLVPHWIIVIWKHLGK